ncbi:MAG: DUF374 domain-containing protein [Hyphomicrobiales bacterium]
MPGLHPPDVSGRVMVARHDDAAGMAKALAQFGLGLIRGAGAGQRTADRGGATAARAALRSLKDGFGLAMTADVPPGPARKSGLGIVTIGQYSGRPIIPFAVASSRYRAVNSWSRMTINLPFSRIGLVMGEPIQIPPSGGDQELEHCRERVEAALNMVTERAYAIAGADMARATPPSVVPFYGYQSEELLFRPLAYGSVAESDQPRDEFSAEDFALLGRCLAFQQSAADLTRLRMELLSNAEAWARLLSVAESVRLVAAVAEQLQKRQLVPPASRVANDGAYSPAQVLLARVATHTARQVLRSTRAS